ncbi:MAG: aspartyl/asparaginyl beta-hydroxylase domain-containing protein [Bdellovibrio sp.]|nr:aspartyl/asparaginyl beta-hydroxylase domain-containing protein [Bdellovibrio sp.]
MISPKRLEDLYLDSSFVCERIDTGFDIASLVSIHAEISKSILPIQKDNNAKYSGYGLQSDDVDDVYYGSLQQTRVHAKDHSYIEIKKFSFHEKRNSLGEKFATVFEKFPFSLFQGRVLITQPGCQIPQHNDGKFRLTLHVPILTNSQCLFDIGGERIHLPADGSSYILNTRSEHSFVNNGTDDRVHLVFSLWPICVTNPSTRFHDEYVQFYERARLVRGA